MLNRLNLAQKIDENLDNANYHSLAGVAERIYFLIKENIDTKTADLIIKLIYEDETFNI